MRLPLRNLTLSVILIAAPAGGFALAEVFIAPTAQTASAETTPAPLGDLSACKDIVADTRRLVAAGDLAAAERRISDLETLWDDHAATLRQADRAGWTAIDAAADDAFSALRAPIPVPARVNATLADLSNALDGPVPLAAPGPVRFVAGIAVTDETGRALPCEDLIDRLRDAMAGATPSAKVSDLQARALERCNADDDARADALAAQALSRMKG